MRDEYETYLHGETDEAITLFCLPGLKAWDHRKAAWIEAPDGLIEIYCKHKWFNVLHIAEQFSNINRIYVNIAMPAVIQAHQLDWIDLDLDYRVHLNNEIELLDRADFEVNVERMGYPQSLIEQAWAACREVEAGLVQGAFPFDHERQVELYRRLKLEHLNSLDVFGETA